MSTPDPLPALRALVEAAAAYIEPIPDNNLVAIHDRWKRLVDAVPAAQEALERMEARLTRLEEALRRIKDIPRYAGHVALHELIDAALEGRDE